MTSICSFVEKKGRGGIFSKKWFDNSAISETRTTIRNTVESLRWDCVEQERAAGSTNAAAPAAARSARGM